MPCRRFVRDCAVLALTGLIVAAGATVACSKGARRHVAAGDEYFAKKQYRAAIVEYENAVKKDPRLGEARFKLAEAYMGVDDRAHAYREYLRAADLLPADLGVQLQAGRASLAAGQLEDAKGRADRILAKHPRNAEAQMLRGSAMIGLKDVAGAIKDVEEAIQIDPSRAGSHATLGALKVSRGDLEEAEASFKKAAELEKDSMNGRLALANFYWWARRYGDAERAFQQALEKKPDDLLANRAIVSFLISRNRPADAEKYLATMAGSAKDANARIMLADYYIWMNRMPEAITLLQEMAKDKETSTAANLRIASMRYLEGKRDEAHKLLDGILSREPQNPQALVGKARFLLSEAMLEAALTAAKAATVAEPRYARAHYLVGQIYRAKNDVESAEKAFSEVLRIAPRSAAAQLQLSQLNLAQGRTEAAVQFAQEALKTQPRNPNMRLLLARTAIAQGDLTRAEAELQGLLEKYPHAAAVHSQIGTVHLLRKNDGAARAAFTRALAIEPRLSEAAAGLVMLDIAARKLGDARQRIEAEIARHPKDPALRVLAAQVYTAEGDSAATERALRAALELDPANARAYGLLGQFYVWQNRLDQARQEFEALSSRQPKNVAAHTMVALILDAQGKASEARLRYERIVQIDPGAAVAANNLAWIYAQSDKLDQALQLAQAAQGRWPEQPDINDTLGWIYYKKGLASLAIPPLEQSVAKDPGNPSYHYHLGLAYVKNGDRRKARESLEQALKLKPDFEGSEQARRALASLGR